jgi:hypothetical protein
MFHELLSRDRKAGRATGESSRVPRDWFRGVPGRYVAGTGTRGHPEGRPYSWSQQAIHETSGQDHFPIFEEAPGPLCLPSQNGLRYLVGRRGTKETLGVLQRNRRDADTGPPGRELLYGNSGEKRLTVQWVPPAGPERGKAEWHLPREGNGEYCYLPVRPSWALRRLPGAAMRWDLISAHMKESHYDQC